MPKIILIPHKFRDYTRYVNGLEDVLDLKGSSFTDFLLPVVGRHGKFRVFDIQTREPALHSLLEHQPEVLAAQP
jgi:hypothetical protein